MWLFGGVDAGGQSAGLGGHGGQHGGAKLSQGPYDGGGPLPALLGALGAGAAKGVAVRVHNRTAGAAPHHALVEGENPLPIPAVEAHVRPPPAHLKNNTKGK